ncbi:hypothetical protein LWI29_016376 [Acer saccharum]|uniref:Uncharacterized protein n=1 Tax=Acer saccharum TaxID=4024 RepID=A0AA39SSR9_ACESA|nr:hypothetical protein LWI29_016376 [Acer saccharum]
MKEDQIRGPTLEVEAWNKPTRAPSFIEPRPVNPSIVLHSQTSNNEQDIIDKGLNEGGLVKSISDSGSISSEGSKKVQDNVFSDELDTYLDQGYSKGSYREERMGSIRIEEREWRSPVKEGRTREMIRQKTFQQRRGRVGSRSCWSRKE